MAESFLKSKKFSQKGGQDLRPGASQDSCYRISSNTAEKSAVKIFEFNKRYLSSGLK